MTNAKSRLILLAGGVCLMGLLIGLMTWSSQRQTNDLRNRLKRLDSEAFHIADQFRDYLRRLNNPLYQYGSTHDAESLAQFHKASHDLDVWIDDQKPKLTTDKEKALMQEIDGTYDNYLLAAERLLKKLQAASQQSATMDDYAELRAQSQVLFNLGQELTEAHYASREITVGRASETITQMRVTALISLGLLFIFGLALAWVVYRDMIAPMRRRLIESQMLVERSEKLASLGMLAAGVAHEIRNPLTAIKAALFLQQKKFVAGTQEFNDAKVVEREILRLERIVNDFLRFARPSEPAFAKVAVAASMNEVASLLAPQMAKAGIQFVVEPSPELFVDADAAQLKQVLINLIQNAADAVGQGGVIKLRARTGQRTLGDKSRKVVILEVADNGKGIPPDVQKRLFDPFFTTKKNGLGLGLSLSRTIAEAHGGRLSVDRLDAVTTFRFYLPLIEERARV